MFNPQNQNIIRHKMLFLIFKCSILILCFHSSSLRSMSLRSSSSSNITFSWRSLSFSSSSSSIISSMSLSFAVMVDFSFLSTLVFKFLGPIKETKKYNKYYKKFNCISFTVKINTPFPFLAWCPLFKSKRFMYIHPWNIFW